MTEKVYERLVKKKATLALVGLGYVGMPIAVAFANKGLNVIGFDLNKAKIELYKSGIDPTKEVGDRAIRDTTVRFTANEADLQEAEFFIVAVPTPINTDHTPDLTPAQRPSETHPCTSSFPGTMLGLATRHAWTRGTHCGRRTR